MRSTLRRELEKRGITCKRDRSGAYVRLDGFFIPLRKPVRMDASARLAFGLCKKYGIDLPDGAGPKEAWEALKEKTGKGAEDFYHSSGEKGSDKIRFGNTDPKKYVQTLAKAKQSQDPEKGWRVTGMTKKEFLDWHKGAKLHVSDGGSTIAVDKSGDIVGVCVGRGDGKKGLISGKTLLAHAVKNGGIKLDSYEGNHKFYVKCGFEPVSWCKWDPAFEEEAMKQGWDPKRDKKESIVFYRYVGVGKVKNVNLREFYKNTPVSKDYDEAYALRDKTVKRGK